MSRIDDYVDYFGMIHSVPVGPGGIPSTNNSVGYTGQYLGLKAIEDPADTLIPMFAEYARLSVEGDVLGRVHSTIQQGPDDYIGFFFASTCFSNIPAIKIMDNKTKLWGILPRYWNNEVKGTYKRKDGKLNLHAWFGRFPGIIAQGKMAIGEPLNFIDKLLFAGSIILSARKPFSHQDAWMQQDILIKTYLVATLYNMYPTSWLIELAIDYWDKKKGDKKIADIFREYTGNPEHPLAEVWLENEEVKRKA